MGYPISKTRLSFSLYVTLHPKFRVHNEKCFNYYRMSFKSFDDQLEMSTSIFIKLCFFKKIID